MRKLFGSAREPSDIDRLTPNRRGPHSAANPVDQDYGRGGAHPHVFLARRVPCGLDGRIAATIMATRNPEGRRELARDAELVKANAPMGAASRAAVVKRNKSSAVQLW